MMTVSTLPVGEGLPAGSRPLMVNLPCMVTTTTSLFSSAAALAFGAGGSVSPAAVNAFRNVVSTAFIAVGDCSLAVADASSATLPISTRFSAAVRPAHRGTSLYPCLTVVIRECDPHLVV